MWVPLDVGVWRCGYLWAYTYRNACAFGHWLVEMWVPLHLCFIETYPICGNELLQMWVPLDIDLWRCGYLCTYTSRNVRDLWN